MIWKVVIMGIKAIKSVENNLRPEPIFELQGMVKLRHEPVSNYYRFLRRVGAGTYGEVFEAEHEQTANKRAIKKINTFKFPRSKAMTLNEVTLLKSLVPPAPPRTTPASSGSTKSSRRQNTSTSSPSTARAGNSSTSSSTSTTCRKRKPATCSMRSCLQ